MLIDIQASALLAVANDGAERVIDARREARVAGARHRVRDAAVVAVVVSAKRRISSAHSPASQTVRFKNVHEGDAVPATVGAHGRDLVVEPAREVGALSRVEAVVGAGAAPAALRADVDVSVDERRVGGTSLRSVIVSYNDIVRIEPGKTMLRLMLLTSTRAGPGPASGEGAATANVASMLARVKKPALNCIVEKSVERDTSRKLAVSSSLLCHRYNCHAFIPVEAAMQIIDTVPSRCQQQCLRA